MPLGGGSAAVGSSLQGSQCGSPAAGASLSLASAERLHASDRRRAARERPAQRRAAVRCIQAGCRPAFAVSPRSTATNAAMPAFSSREQLLFIGNPERTQFFKKRNARIVDGTPSGGACRARRQASVVSAATWSGEPC